MFAFAESDNLIIVTYRPGPGDIYKAFARGFGEITAPFRYDHLIDLRGMTGPVDIPSSTELGKRWTELTRGHDVGRRTAVVCDDEAFQKQLDVFRLVYPFRKIAMFSDFDAAMAWLMDISDTGEDEVQFI